MLLFVHFLSRGSFFGWLCSLSSSSTEKNYMFLGRVEVVTLRTRCMSQPPRFSGPLFARRDRGFGLDVESSSSLVLVFCCKILMMRWIHFMCAVFSLAVSVCCHLAVKDMNSLTSYTICLGCQCVVLSHMTISMYIFRPILVFSQISVYRLTRGDVRGDVCLPSDVSLTICTKMSVH